MWKEFQDFLKNPDDVDGAAQAMEQVGGESVLT